MAIEPFVPPRRFHGDDDESIAEFATRRLGKEAAERLVAPLLGGISAGDANDISVRASFPQLVTMERDYGSLVQGMRVARRARSGGGGSAFTSLEGGTGQLVGALVERLRADGVTLHESRRADAVAREGGAWVVHTGGGERLLADAVVVAVPAHAAAAVLEGLDDALSSALRSIQFGSTATAFLGYRSADVKHPLDGVGFVVPRAAGRPILASTWVSSKWAGRAPEGHVLLRAFFGGAWGEDVLSHDDEGLVRVARTELRTLMGLDAEPVLTRVFRFDKASAQMRVGHLATMRTLRERLEATAPGLLIAGGGYDGVGIPDSIRQGEEAGRALLA